MIEHKRTERCSGMIDFFSNPLWNYNDILAIDFVNIGKNTKDIIKEIKTQSMPVNEVVNRINRLKKTGNQHLAVGCGFA